MRMGIYNRHPFSDMEVDTVHATNNNLTKKQDSVVKRD